jgi:sugar/nucleoside kinase (ribokinase family)
VTGARIAVAGDVMTDVVAALSGPVAPGSDTAARIALGGGGAGANVAVWLARAGATVTLIGRVGDDSAGRDAAAALRAEGVDTRLAIDPARPTGTCIVLVEPGGERSMLPDAGANAGLEPVALPPDAVHLHVAGYALLHPGSRPAACALLAAAQTAGLSVSIDPSSAAPLRRAGASAFLGWVAGAGMLLPNRDEATALTGIADPVAAARTLTRHAREVVVKLGAQGALWTDGESEVRAAALPVAVVDTTGAGDAFAAGLLAARVAGAGPAEALRAGCTLAAAAVGRRGGR